MRDIELFKLDPMKLFERMCDEAELKFCPRGVFMWNSVMPRPYLSHGRPVTTCYGSYRTVTPEELAKRTYEFGFMDYRLSIFWTDVWFIPRGSKHVLRPSHERGLGYKESCLLKPSEEPEWANML